MKFNITISHIPTGNSRYLAQTFICLIEDFFDGAYQYVPTSEKSTNKEDERGQCFTLKERTVVRIGW